MYRLIKIYFFVLVFVSCGKKWKQTTDVNVRFVIPQSSTGMLTITSVKMMVGEIDFSGDRKKGEDVSFSDPEPAPLLLNLSPGGTALSADHYDIPQGVYTNINLTVKAVTQSASPSISVYGAFTHDMSEEEIEMKEKTKTFPVLFEYSINQAFNTNAMTTSGSEEITLIEGTPAICEISLNPAYWFAGITEKQYENASVDTLNGVATIVINQTTNQDIYNLIVPAITGTTKVVFK